MSRIATGSGRKNRLTKEDVQNFVKRALAGGGAGVPAANAGGGGLNLLPWPQVDFAKFGEIESKPLSRIKKISGANLARNWAMIPHVTQNDEADITEMEAFRKKLGEENKDLKITPLVFLITYNFVHLVTRGWLFVAGYRHGSAVVARLAELKVPMWSNRLRGLAAAAAGGMGAWLALGFGTRTATPWLGAACLALGAGAVLLVERKLPPLALLYGAAVLATVAGALW